MAAINERAVLFGDLGLFDEAVAECKRAVGKGIADPALHTNLAVAYINKGEYDSALVELNKAIALDSSYKRAQQVKNVALSRLGK